MDGNTLSQRWKNINDAAFLEMQSLVAGTSLSDLVSGIPPSEVPKRVFPPYPLDQLRLQGFKQGNPLEYPFGYLALTIDPFEAVLTTVSTPPIVLRVYNDTSVNDTYRAWSSEVIKAAEKSRNQGLTQALD